MRRKIISVHKIRFAIAVLIVGMMLISGCGKQPVSDQEPSVLKTEPVDLSDVQTEKLSFAKYYFLESLDIAVQVSQYNLPLETSRISNFNSFLSEITLSNEALKKLQANGFVVIDNPFDLNEEDITEPYKNLKEVETPIFITSDSLLHLYQIYHHQHFEEQVLH